MLCANCLDVNLHTVFRGDHKGFPQHGEGKRIWITRISDPSTVWVVGWDAAPECEFCHFLHKLRCPLSVMEGIRPQYLQIDIGKSYYKYERSLSGIMSINLVFGWSGTRATYPSGEGGIDYWTQKHPATPSSSLSMIAPFSLSEKAYNQAVLPLPLALREVPPWIDLGVIQGHLDDCFGEHRSCGQESNRLSGPPVRLRVIDCSSLTVVPAPSPVEYTALSYRWGTHHANFVVLNGAPLPTKVPATIEDAIRVTLGLGFQYLWVDAYCVSQEDEDDFRHQLRQMHLIYHFAQVTIIAAGSMDADSGLSGVSRPRTNCQSKGQYDDLDLITFSPNPISTKLLQDEWVKRGWTFQEGFFARQRLIFKDEQVLFDCYEGVTSEEINHPRDFHAMPRWRAGTKENDVYNLISKYTARTLTHNEDILNAFDGIMEAFESRSPSVRSLWGIPLLHHAGGDYSYLSGSLVGLCWARGSKNGQSCRRTGFPSWSWAGWLHTGPIHYVLELVAHSELTVARGLSIQLERRDGLLQSWSAFEAAAPASTHRQHYSPHIHLSASSLMVKLVKIGSTRHGDRQYIGRNAKILRDTKPDYWAAEAALDSPFESLELSYDPDRPDEVRTCYAIHLFSSSKLRRITIDIAQHVFAFLLVSKRGSQWERVGLWLPSFKFEDDASSFQQWLQRSSTAEQHTFVIA